eukprot:UN33986
MKLELSNLGSGDKKEAKREAGVAEEIFRKLDSPRRPEYANNQRSGFNVVSEVGLTEASSHEHMHRRFKTVRDQEYQPFKKFSYFSYKLQPNTYSVVLLTPLSTPWLCDWRSILDIQTFILHLVNLLIQAVTIWMLGRILVEDEDYSTCNEELEWPLLFVSLIIFVAKLLREFMDCVFFSLW